MSRSPIDDRTISQGHGGYRVDTRFRDRWVFAPDPADADSFPSAANAARTHPYLRRISGKGWNIHRQWAFRVGRGPESSDASAQLVFVYYNESSDEHEAVVIENPAMFTRWVAAMIRRMSP